VSADRSRASGHDAKAVKGVLARELIVTGPSALRGFRWRGWRSAATTAGWEIIAPSS
jgi:hypothetical protein